MPRQTTVWSTEDRSRWFLVPDDLPAVPGTLRVRSLEGRSAQIDADWLAPFQVTEDQARRWAKDQLGQTLGELKQGLDDTLAGLRQRLDEFNRTPVQEGTAITPDAASAVFDLLKQLPRVLGQSLSGDDSRVAAAAETMADLQRRLKEAGIDVDDRVKEFPARLAELRKPPRTSRDET
jgi:hypothetical protein